MPPGYGSTESGRGDVLITDVALPDGDALDLLPRIKERRPDLPVCDECAVNIVNGCQNPANWCF